MPEERSASVRLTWQIALILLPFLVLLFFGAYFLRQDRLLVEGEAREKAVELAREVLDRFVQARTNFLSPEFYTNLIVWPETEVFFQVTRDGELYFPRKAETNSNFTPIIAQLATGYSNLWVQAERAEYARNDPAEAATFWKALSVTNVPPRARAVAEFNYGVVLSRLGESEKAVAVFDQLRLTPVSARFDSGMPISYLATLKLLREQTNATLFDAALTFVLEPTEFSEFFLNQFSQEWPSKAVWEEQTRSRSLFAASATRAEERSVKLQNVKWWLYRFGTNVFARSEAGMQQIAADIVQRTKRPEYLSIALVSGEETVAEIEDHPPGRLLAAQSLAEDSGTRAEVYLTRPELVYRRQHQRALWLGSVLVLSSIVATGGLVHTARSHWKQHRLNELKSNFVSSVSHELRAPLASMRLMSEGLQGGRINDPEKQREYFKYLVQECRRLSVLVENVLDFSQIDQEKKVYEFELADLREIIHAAMRTMTPVAAERGVKLQFNQETEESRFESKVDPGALQQAVVNLLDNSIKHSPVEQTVMINLQAKVDRFEISVQDQGPGIPLKEQEKIFDRFYRLGSELRRETPGVGIGLSIVKHIVDGHGGSVVVKSQPNEGATFIITLPRS